jgi:hypothetical protein
LDPKHLHQQALYDYQARMSSFCDCEPTEGWVEEVGLSTAFLPTSPRWRRRGWGDESENNPLGSLQKGSINIVGAEVELVDRPAGVVGIMIEVGNELRCASREGGLGQKSFRFCSNLE